MAIRKSDIIKAKESTDYVAKTLASSPKVGALKLEDYPIYTMLGTEVNNDIIELTELPAGAAIIPQRCFTSFGTPSPFTSAVIGLGTPEEPTKFGYAQLFTAEQWRPDSYFGYVDGADFPRFPEVPISDKPQKIVAQFVGTPAGKVVGGKLFFGLEYRIRG